jgi:hypothetical protein
VHSTHALETGGERLEEPLGQQGQSILLSLPVPNRQLPSFKIDVLDPQSTALQNAQGGAVHE